MLLPSTYTPQAPLPFQVQTRSSLAASTEAIPVYPGQSGKLVVVMTCTQNAYVRFGQANVTAATAADYRIIAGRLYAFETTAATSYFTVIRQTADGVLSFYVPGAPGAAGFPVLPSGPPPLEAWDAQHGVSLVSGLVDSWTGLIRGVRASAPSAAKRPAYGVDGANFKGLPVLQFDGIDDTLTNLNINPALYLDSTPHVLSVFRSRVTTHTDCIVQFSNTAQDVLNIIYRYNNNAVRAWWLAESALLTASPVVNQAVTLADSFANSSGELTVRVDNGTPTADTGVVSTTGPADRLFFGSERNNADFSSANLAAVLVYPTALTAQQYATVLAFYQARYGTL